MDAIVEAAIASSISPAGPSSVVSTPSTSSNSQQQSSNVCKYYKKGKCRYGAACRNAHVGEPETEQANAPVPAKKQSASTPDPLTWINAPEFVPKSKQVVAVAPQASIASSSSVRQVSALDAELGDDEREDDDNGYDEEEEEGEEDVRNLQEDSAEPSPPRASGSSGLSYAAIVTMNNNHNGLGIVEEAVDDSVLCPYFENSGICMLGACPYQHGDLCELCGKFCLNPASPEQQRQHNIECIKQHEQDMEHSFAIQRSKDKICGICLEVIFEKPSREQRFGILPNCAHSFCLECIRTWRKAKNFENKIKRGCPTCRISSDFVCPSTVWVEAREDKDKLIADYKRACGTTHCKHFKQGTGKCPFGNKCFYKHALPSGQLVDVGGPSRQSENRLRTHLQDFFREMLHYRGRLLEDYMSSFSIFSDSDESDLSELFDMYDS